MASPFDFTHLDPSLDPPELYCAAFDLLGDLWGQLGRFRSTCLQDEFLTVLTGDLQRRVVAAGLVLAVKIELQSSP